MPAPTILMTLQATNGIEPVTWVITPVAGTAAYTVHVNGGLMGSTGEESVYASDLAAALAIVASEQRLTIEDASY